MHSEADFAEGGNSHTFTTVEGWMPQFHSVRGSRVVLGRVIGTSAVWFGLPYGVGATLWLSARMLLPLWEFVPPRVADTASH